MALSSIHRNQRQSQMPQAPSIDLEEKLAHTSKLAEDLSDIVAEQAKQITLLEKKVDALMNLARDSAQGEGSVTLSDRPPPHW